MPEASKSDPPSLVCPGSCSAMRLLHVYFIIGTYKIRLLLVGDVASGYTHSNPRKNAPVSRTLQDISFTSDGRWLAASLRDGGLRTLARTLQCRDFEGQGCGALSGGLVFVQIWTLVFDFRALEVKARFRHQFRATSAKIASCLGLLRAF